MEKHAERKISTVRDARINVKPVTICMAHQYVFEGPCRFGRTEESLTTEFDQMSNRASHKAFIAGLEEHLPGAICNIMEPLFIERDERWLIDDAYLEQLAEDADDVDVYWLNCSGFEMFLDFYEHYNIKTPVVTMKAATRNFQVTATFRARGVDSWGFWTWDEAIQRMRVLRARKVLRNTKVLAGLRFDPLKSETVLEGFLDLRTVQEKLGCRVRYINVHELLDQANRCAPDQNPSLPGRVCNNLSETELAAVDKEVDEFIAGADTCAMDREYVKRSFEFFNVVQKLLEENQCSAFTMPCADVCATRRYNEGKFTSCLTHTLNNEMGICSACEFDMPCLLSMVMLSALSDSAPYMGNTSQVTLDQEASKLSRLLDQKSLDAIKDEVATGNVFYTFHSVPNRKLHGFDAEPANYSIRQFAAVQGFGATLRYDFGKDAGQIITMAHLDPACKRLIIARGTIVGGLGYEDINCSEGVFFSVKDAKKYNEAFSWAGIHIPLVYGDVFDELVMLGNLLGLEVIEAE